MLAQNDSIGEDIKKIQAELDEQLIREEVKWFQRVGGYS